MTDSNDDTASHCHCCRAGGQSPARAIDAQSLGGHDTWRANSRRSARGRPDDDRSGSVDA